MADTTGQPKIRVLVAREEVANDGVTPVHVVARIEGAPIKLAERPPLRIMLAIDVSSSMKEHADEDRATTKLGMVKKTVRRLIAFLTPQDTVGLVIYSNRAQLVFPPQTMTPQAKEALRQAVNALRTDSNTNISDALNVAGEALQTIPRVNPTDPLYLLLLTDGEPTVGLCTTEELLRFMLVNPWAQNVRVLAAGVGLSYNAGLLQALSRETHGEFAHIKAEAQFAAALGDLLGAAASAQHVNIEVAFVPDKGVGLVQVFTTERVESYTEHRVQVAMVGDIFAESTRAVAAELRISRQEPCPSSAIRICRVVVRGVNVQTGREWTHESSCEIRITDGQPRASWNAAACQMLVELVAKAAADQALAHARAGNFGTSAAKVEQALTFVRSVAVSVPQVKLEHVLELLQEVQRIVNDPGQFRQADHAATARTVWFGQRGDTGRQTLVQQTLTILMRPPELPEHGDDPDQS